MTFRGYKLIKSSEKGVLLLDTIQFWICTDQEGSYAIELFKPKQALKRLQKL